MTREPLPEQVDRLLDAFRDLRAEELPNAPGLGRYPPRTRIPSRLSGHGCKRRGRLVMVRTADPPQRRERDLRLEQRHIPALVQVTAEPAQCCPLKLRRLVSGVQQDKLEGLLEAESNLMGGRLGDDDVPAFDRPAKLHPRMPLRRRQPSWWGRTARTA
jgi:hypothetical protein